MNEYSITAEELQEIFDLMADGWRCTTLEEGATLYICLELCSETREFEFVKC
jgi:exoribonuclease II